MTRPVFLGVWYFPPVGFGLVLGFLIVALTVSEAIVKRIPLLSIRTVPPALVIGAWTILSVIAIPKTIRNAISFRENVDLVYLPLAAAIAEDPREQISTLANDIGYLGYFCDCKVIDAGALVSPEVLAFYKDPGRRGDSLVEAFMPDYYALPVKRQINQMFQSNPMRNQYEAISRFQKYGETDLTAFPDPSESYVRSPEYVGDFVLYQKLRR